MLMFSFTYNHVLSQNLVKNPGFETGFLSPYWGSWPIGTSFANIDINNAFAGEFCVKLENNEVFFYQPVSLEPNTTYKISAAIKTESGDSILFGVSKVNSEGGKSIYFLNDTNYETVSLSFTTDESPGNGPNIYVWKKNGTGVVWVDDIVMNIEPQVNQPKPPGGFGSFYVSPQGNDSNTGTSPNQAWQTINKVNSKDFGPGDQILFEGGKTFNGTIVLNNDDYGSLNNNVYFGSYGTGRAIINAQTGSGLIAYDCNNISIKNLNFIGDGRLDGNTGNGLTFSYCSNIVVDSVEISGFQHSGLTAKNVGYNYRLTNIYAHNNGFAGIYVSGTDKESLSDIYIGYSTADNNPGDPTVLKNHSGNGIFGYNVTNMVIEYCKASNNGGDMPWNQNGPGGIWVAEADSVIIQYCISHDNKTSPGALDGLGFDLDGGTTNSVIQYCLSYNNQGAGYGIFQYANATDWKNNTVRYCISENDGNVSAKGSVYFWNGSGNANKFQGFEFYNNVVYNANGPALAFLDHKNLNFNFRNNIFVSKSGKIYDRINGENFQGNSWYSLANSTTQDSLDFITWALANNQEMLNNSLAGIYANARFVNPGNSNLTNPLLLATIDDYKLKVESPVIDKGLDLESLCNINPGNRDYFGNPVKQGMAFNMGIDQFADRQEISLGIGWNIFSANLVPNDSNLMKILQPLIHSGKLKKVMDEEGNTIEDRGVYGGWINTIGNIKIPEGYSINVTSPSTVEIKGGRIQLPLNLTLNKGWNKLSWPAQTAQNGMDVFQILIDEGKLRKVMDEEGKTIEDWGTFGGWKNSIGNFTPGEGYKVNVTENCILTINEHVIKSQKYIQDSEKTVYFMPAYQGNGINHMNINVVDLPAHVINIGDELAIFDNEICVGAVKVQPHHLRDFSVSIPTSASDNYGLKGFTEGNSFCLKHWDSQQKKEIQIDPLVLGGPSTFSKNETSFISFEKYTATANPKTAGLKNTGIRCYPNPFSNGLNVEINLENDSKVQVEVLNQLGQQVKVIFPKNQLNRGNHEIRWNGENSSNQQITTGIYLVRAIIGDNIFYEKVICQ